MEEKQMIKFQKFSNLFELFGSHFTLVASTAGESFVHLSMDGASVNLWVFYLDWISISFLRR